MSRSVSSHTLLTTGNVTPRYRLCSADGFGPMAQAILESPQDMGCPHSVALLGFGPMAQAILESPQDMGCPHSIALLGFGARAAQSAHWHGQYFSLECIWNVSTA